MQLSDELRAISAAYKSPKIDELKEILKEAAGKGNRGISLDRKFYDKDAIIWLKSQGIKVEEISDQRDGTFIMVSW